MRKFDARHQAVSPEVIEPICIKLAGHDGCINVFGLFFAKELRDLPRERGINVREYSGYGCILGDDLCSPVNMRPLLKACSKAWLKGPCPMS